MYECSVEYTTADVAPQAPQDFLFTWECLVDASLTFGGDEKNQDSSTTHKVDNNHGEEQSEKLIQHNQDESETTSAGADKTTVRCLFTSVYINDIHLMKMGMREEEENFKQSQKQEEKVDEKAKRADSEEQKPPAAAGEEVKLNGGIKTEEPEATEPTAVPSSISKSREQLKEEGKERKRLKHCRDFENKIRELGFAPGLADQIPAVPAVIPSSTAATLGTLQQANFTHYQSQNYNKHQQQFLNFKSPSTSTGGGRSRSTSPPPNSSGSTNSGNNKEETEEEKEPKPELSLEERLHFDFGFDPERDQRLVARSAKKFFAKDKEMMKYWYQRFRFFSRLNQGILLDRQSWFSVTPELLAQHVADRLVRIQDCTILDAFAGAGGNSIQFALRGAFVFSVDIDPVKLRCSLHNARIYGAAHRCNFICGDFFHIARSMLGAREAKEQSGAVQSLSYDPYPFGLDAVYLSPPWGGPAYRGDEKRNAREFFDLRRDMEDLDGVHIFELAKRLTPNIVYFLPKNTSTKQLIALAAPDGKVELEQGSLNGKVKALHAYYGRLVAPEE